MFETHCRIGEPKPFKPSLARASGKTKRQAKDALKERCAEWKPKATWGGSYDKKCTVADAARAWLTSYEKHPGKRPQNSQTYRKEIERSTSTRAKKDKFVVVDSTLGRMQAVDVKPYHIRLHLEELNWSTTKQEVHKSLLRMTFQMLVEDGLLDFNPVASVRIHGRVGPRRKAGRAGAVNPYFPDEPQPLTPDEMRRYWQLEAARFADPANRRPKRYRDYTKLAYTLAARPSEAVAVQWGDVDFAAGTVTIAGTIVDCSLRVWQVRKVVDDYALAAHEIVVRGDWHELDDQAVVTVAFRQPFTKTRGSMRTIKVDAECLAMLRERKLAAAPGQALVFPSRVGKILRTNKLSTVWHAIVKDTELSWSTLKTLRSTRATRVAEVHGIPAARLILGHDENSAITTQAYVSLARPVVDFADAG
ncbi:site-specific integrase [Nocardia sp. NBC_01327]|uniref:site-specific integrase n=1 Tax=Nocardia sp. NBC_01327 TaxID=2903593 RepID=UPI002E0EC0C9|nr:tyrosine-type recombinase/integrase [Nocardia sp. NBC_01327]